MKKSFLINTILIILELIAFIITWQVNGPIMFGYYTQESNLLLLITCIVYETWLIRHWGQSDRTMPKSLYIWIYIATSMVGETFIIVILVLAPMSFFKSTTLGIEMLVGNANFFQHLTCPLLASFSFLRLNQPQMLSRKENIIAVLPTFLYAIITISLNVAKVIEGPYPFLMVYRQPLYMTIFWSFSIPLAAYLFAYLFRTLLPTKRL